MSHAHFHRHERRNFISDVEDFFGVNYAKGPQSTVTETASIVYVTASPTFTGPIGGYITGTDTASPADPTTTAGKGAPVAQSSTKTTAASSKSDTSTTTKAPAPTTHTTSTLSTTSTSLSDLLTTLSDPPATTFLTSSSTQSASSTSTDTALDQLSSSPTASPTTSAAASTSNGLTGGAKAGIAIGVLFGVGLIAGLILFWLHKQKKNREEAAAAAAAAENEKFTPSQPPPMTSAQSPQSMAAYSSAPSTPATAPQVSLRPITQFNPLLSQPGGANPYAAGAVGAAVGGAAAAAGGLQVNRSAERPYSGSAHVPPQSPRQDPFTDPVNPFDNGAQTASPPMPPAKDASSPVRDLTPSPTGSAHNLASPIAEEPSAGSVEAAAAGAVAGAAVGAAAVAAAAAKSDDKPAESRTPSPEYVENAGSRPQSPVVGGAGAPVSNVHRVQMDFTPSLADEMELRAGQLVRLLKSYDDGWTQCSSMDGSVQGIAPRTCLSARPLQPRRSPGPNGPGGPRGPPIMAPNGRPMSPAGGRMGPPPQMKGAPPRFYNDGRPMTPTGSGMPQFPPPPGTPRAMSPGPGRGVDVPRPLTPGGSRPASPAGGRSRSNSASVAQMGGRPAMHRGSQSPLAPPTGPLPGPPMQPVQSPTAAPAAPAPQVQNDARPEPAIERKPVPGQQ
ncbi:hypothetical protein TMatcc_006156 [Talaromyces marneffei ATCC 18224]|uniref:SH3 domain protein n=1 Tax=Talaromyces marneffei (strain ATCC 18224 / CBS 334.59 / QM 7333) TaxID=441960 RepID=B6QCB6_TALMQ|nr:SH3 domain protein [Talaromyces marneffei ATCC 18224]